MPTGCRVCGGRREQGGETRLQGTSNRQLRRLVRRARAGRCGRGKPRISRKPLRRRAAARPRDWKGSPVRARTVTRSPETGTGWPGSLTRRDGRGMPWPVLRGRDLTACQGLARCGVAGAGVHGRGPAADPIAGRRPGGGTTHGPPWGAPSAPGPGLRVLGPAPAGTGPTQTTRRRGLLNIRRRLGEEIFSTEIFSDSEKRSSQRASHKFSTSDTFVGTAGAPSRWRTNQNKCGEKI